MRKENKLSESTDFQRVFEQNKALRDRYWLILYRPNQVNKARLGLVVSKKNVNKAVQRNRIKRLIRETFRHNKDELGSVDAIVLVQQGVSEKSNRELISAINTLWGKLASEDKQQAEK